MKTVLTIAGSDCSGGAGIQADIKTITCNGVYASSVIAALTAQNTTGVTGIMNVPADFIAKQIDAVFTDIRPDAVKIGMVSNKDAIKTIADKLREYKADNVVVDTVMVSTSGSRLLEEDAIEVLISELIPLATVITPNIPEAEVLCGHEITTAEAMHKAAEELEKKFNVSVLVKGGHSICDSNDVLCSGGKITVFNGERIDNPNTHGTGCTISSAIASNLAKGMALPDAITKAKEYISGALRYGLDLGKGSGPLWHGYNAVELRQ